MLPRLFVIFGAFLSTVSVQAFAASSYTCVAIESDLNNLSPVGINDKGQVTGTYGIPDTDTSGGFLREPDGSITTFSYPGSTGTFPTGINNRGQITGVYRVGNTPGVFVREPDGSLTSMRRPQMGLIFLSAGSTIAARFQEVTFPATTPISSLLTRDALMRLSIRSPEWSRVQSRPVPSTMRVILWRTGIHSWAPWVSQSYGKPTGSISR